MVVHSMTGFGSHRAAVEEYQYLFEVKSLNSKSSDFRLYLPNALKELESDLRVLIKHYCVRGKVDFSITAEGERTPEQYRINEALLDDYYGQLLKWALKHQVALPDPVSAIVRLPNVTISQGLVLSEAMKTSILEHCELCLENLNAFRQKEGSSIGVFLAERIDALSQLLSQVVELAPLRYGRIKDRIHSHLLQLQARIEIDAARYEQEMMYYMEKMDFSEESQRLEQHLSYFRETLNLPHKVKGRKLSFVSQEIGREINTLGSKANDAQIQRIVVDMKDELEKIKEQLANIL